MVSSDLFHQRDNSLPEQDWLQDKKADKEEGMRERQACVYQEDKGQRQDNSPLVLGIESKTDLDLCMVIKVLAASQPPHVAMDHAQQQDQRQPPM